MAVVPPSQGRLRHLNDSHRVLPRQQCGEGHAQALPAPRFEAEGESGPRAESPQLRGVVAIMLIARVSLRAGPTFNPSRPSTSRSQTFNPCRPRTSPQRNPQRTWCLPTTRPLSFHPLRGAYGTSTTAIVSFHVSSAGGPRRSSREVRGSRAKARPRSRARPTVTFGALGAQPSLRWAARATKSASVTMPMSRPVSSSTQRLPIFRSSMR